MVRYLIQTQELNSTKWDIRWTVDEQNQSKQEYEAIRIFNDRKKYSDPLRAIRVVEQRMSGGDQWITFNVVWYKESP
jgi:hypothetical protein